ncbi:MAG: hypothetical protein HY720_06900 [Planctomycetes bacterium]|nr:hypothetical protein [Planctomycetota bacterium]
MRRRAIDFDRLRAALPRLTRGDLLLLVERAIEEIPEAKLRSIMGDFVPVVDVASTKAGAAGVLKEVRKFHDASGRGEYYDSFGVNSKNWTQKSEGTEEFIAEFDGLLGRCVRASEKRPRAPLREAFELLLALLRRIDHSPDDVVFFADEAGSWQVGVDWRTALPAYFRCLADVAGPDEFTREVDRAISDFANHERPRLLTAARRVASVEQKRALRDLARGEKEKEKEKGK